KLSVPAEHAPHHQRWLVYGSVARGDGDALRGVFTGPAVAIAGHSDPVFRLCALAAELAPGRRFEGRIRVLERQATWRSHVARAGDGSSSSGAAHNARRALSRGFLRTDLAGFEGFQSPGRRHALHDHDGG